MSFFISMVKNKFLFLAVFIITASLLQTGDLNARTKKQSQKPNKEATTFPDEYSELDEVPTPTKTKDKAVVKTLEQSRQKYLQALIFIEKKDTASAAKLFEESINILNKLVNYPAIEQNDDFTDLAQSIIEDYESFIQSINNLDENSSLFIIRDKLFQEVETSKIQTQPKIQPIATDKDTLKKDVPIKTEPKFQIDLTDNDYVQKNITFLTTGKPRKVYQRWLERSTRWFPMIKQIIKEEGLPDEIIYLAMIESGLNPLAVSRAKAVGMWQFIRSTGELYGLNAKGSAFVDERRDPEKATRAAMRHLKDLYNDLGDWHLALAAYNCGANGVKRAIAKSKLDKPDFWGIRQFLPKETRNYVPQYIAAAKITLDPEKYGFKKSDMNFMDEFKYDTYSVKEPINVKALAKCCNITPEEFQIYNPELIAACTPADIPEYKLRIPFGSQQSFIATFATLTPEEKEPWVMHKVERGESVRSIAEDFGVSEQLIMSANDVSGSRTKLRKGTVIRIPIDQKDYADLKQKMENAKSAAIKNDGEDDSEEEVADTSKYITHVVAQGETINSVSQSFGVRPSDLRNLNNIPYDTDSLETGKVIKIAQNVKPAEKTTIADAAPTKNIIVKHKVRPGETLAQVADDYNVSIETIKETNRIKNHLLTGQILKINTTTGKSKTASNEKYAQVKKEKRYTEPIAQQRITHKVKKGENLGTIAARYGVTESQLKKWNPKMISGNKVLYGTKLKVYADEPSKGSSSASAKKVNKLPKYYTVKRGDQLSTIAHKFGVSVKSLKKANKNITDKSLKKGQKIRIQ